MTKMFQRLAICLLVSLTGCAPHEFGMSQMQLNGETEQLSESYQDRAVDAVGAKLSLANAQISAPAMMVGDSMFSPRRWFVCILGHDQKTGAPASAIVILHATRPASAKVFARAQLCDDLRYRPLIAS